MTNTIELEVALLRAGITKREAAKKLDITVVGLYSKINNLTEFKASEIAKLSELLHLSVQEQQKIFFAPSVD